MRALDAGQPQQAQRAKREAGDALREGRTDDAADIWRTASAQLSSVQAAPAMAAEMAEESRILHELAARAEHEDPSRLAKLSEADRHRKERRRGGGR